jgi:hypothetical protein
MSVTFTISGRDMSSNGVNTGGYKLFIGYTSITTNSERTISEEMVMGDDA